MKFAKSFADTLPTQFGLKPYLHSVMSGMEPARSITTLHASEMTKPVEFCPRSYALMELTNHTPPPQYVNTSLRYTYDIGRALERELRDNWASNIAIGIWDCVSCGTEHKFQFRPHKCKYCGQSKSGFRYQEMRFTSLVSGMSGGVDLLVKFPGAKKATMIEAKTMDKDEWILLKAAKAEHRLRTNLYLRLIDESDHPLKQFIDTERALVLYMVKAYGKADSTLAELGIKDKHSPFKEYLVKRDDSATDKYTKQGAKWKKWREERLMPNRICTDGLCVRAKKCSVRQICFSGPYETGKHYPGEGL